MTYACFMGKWYTQRESSGRRRVHYVAPDTCYGQLKRIYVNSSLLFCLTFLCNVQIMYCSFYDERSIELYKVNEPITVCEMYGEGEVLNLQCNESSLYGR